VVPVVCLTSVRGALPWFRRCSRGRWGAGSWSRGRRCAAGGGRCATGYVLLVSEPYSPDL